MFTQLIKLIAKQSEDTSANERKFVVSDYSANIARLLGANSSGKTCDSILKILNYFKGYIYLLKIIKLFQGVYISS